MILLMVRLSQNFTNRIQKSFTERKDENNESGKTGQ